jgi:2-keto-4-pentenoate hydratase/2-oxohepta-3-ene-1,7-dioic acid hydratase in catechol pathway
MKYLSYRHADGHEGVGVVIGSRVIDLAVPGARDGISPMRRLLEASDGVLPTAVASTADSPAFDFDLDEVEVLPVVPDPTKIVAAPVNQDAHVDALGVFLKAPSSVLADRGTVQLPYRDRRFDQEGELALVIGRRARNVEPADVWRHIAGYTCLLDMTMRGGEDRSVRKSFETFTPVGPYLVTPDEVGDPRDLRLRTWVNEELRQDADTADLIWDVAALVAYTSTVMTLQPGDILTTGTPAGVGRVRDGDTVTVEIGRVGRLSVTVSSAGAVDCPTRGADRGPKPPETVTPVRRRCS